MGRGRGSAPWSVSALGPGQIKGNHSCTELMYFQNGYVSEASLVKFPKGTESRNSFQKGKGKKEKKKKKHEIKRNNTLHHR